MRLWSLPKKETNAHARFAAVDDACSLTVLHIFRALLRQCTYLPDPAARQYMHRHIVSRFRDYHPQSTLPFTSRRHKSTPSSGNESLTCCGQPVEASCFYVEPTMGTSDTWVGSWR